MTFLLVLIFIVRAEDRHLGSVQKNEIVPYQGPKRPITAGTPLANLAPVKAEARNKSLAWQDKYCRTGQTPTTPLFCKHALRSSLECEIGSAVEPLREKNINVKPACHKIYQGRYYLLIFSF